MSLDVWLSDENGDVLFSYNITHNLNTMAGEAKLYRPVWRPDENGITKACQLIEPLKKGIAMMEANPMRFWKLNPPNGWGTYEDLKLFFQRYLAACEQWPDAEISVYR
jgi:hypothetical protein